MRKVQLRDAKASLSSIVDDATHGRPSIITRHGTPEAVIIGFVEWQRLSNVPSSDNCWHRLRSSPAICRSATPRPYGRSSFEMYLVDTSVISAAAPAKAVPGQRPWSPG